MTPPKPKRKTSYQIVLDALFEYSKRSINRRSGAMPLSAISIVEFMDRNGKYWFAVIDDGTIPRWRKIGLLYHALDELALEPEPNGEEEDDET